MKLFTLPNLTSHAVTPTDDVALSVVKNPRPAGLTKQTYNDWCRAASTKAHFISAWEGINSQGRIIAQNPGRMLHGIIADYDNPNALSKLQNLPTSTTHLPTWVIESFSPGKCRLIWPFENPVNVSNPELTEQFLKVLNEKIKISDALPGFDKSSWKDTQYFELGTNWQSVTGATPIPDGLIAQCMMEAGQQKPIDSGDVEIPLDLIAEEVEKRWPGRWPTGTFVEGAVGPLFWVEPFVNHRSCAVSLNGMICYSDRAASNFMPWRAIFGAKFVEKFEQDRAARIAEMFWYQAGGTYWTDKFDANRWQYYPENATSRHLKEAGCSIKTRKGKQTTELDDVISYIQKHRWVDAAVPLLFQPRGVVENGTRKYLNISTKSVLPPAETGDPKDFPWIYDYVMNAFAGEQDGIPAREYFLGWFQRFYQTAYEGNPQQGQSIVIAGEAHTGKTFLSKRVIGPALGGSCTAEDILLGSTKFNREAAENAVWRLDDAIAQGDQKTKQQLANALKQMAANPSVTYQPKFVDSTELPFMGRVILTCNVDPESLRILPSMDGTIKDKLMLFRINPSYRPKFFSTNSENEERALRELPHFLRWLLDYKVDPRILDPLNSRFAVKSFHYGELIQEANSEQFESRLAEAIALLMQVKRGDVKKGELMKVNVTELAQAFEESGLGKPLQQLGGIRNIGKLLRKVIEQKLSCHITQLPKISRGCHVYLFDPHATDEE